MRIPESMKAVILPARGRMALGTKPVPRPGPDDVLVRVAGCGICGTDIKIRDHGLPGQPPFGSFTPGHEYAGTVIAVGASVDEFAVGDRVVVEAHKGCGRCENCLGGMYTACLNYGNVAKGHRCNGITTDGGLAEYAVNHVNTLYKIPDNVSFEEAIMVMTAGSPLYGLENAGGYIVGETVAILGPGPIGLMAVQLCRAMGAARIILTGTREGRLKLGRELGADLTVNVRQDNPVAAVLEATGGRGADLVIDCAGGDETFQQCLQMVKRGGKILLVAFYGGPVTADISIAVRNNVTIYTERGEGGGSVGRALALLATGKIVAKPLITHRFPLEEHDRAFEVFEKRIGDPIKVILNP
jgi:L-iditol 2-dehydrogenase